ncbi:TPR repeat [Carpediemonas membranifera]|uniref:TPR repeat n=1 Tax=Carpediemonas membranifera TaxID=201153 RepID=A0A8J6BA50_9EUKA|nr:TPR repeat [Carpediemonas membranifera]|eukprot:KAG9393132.1 TPR repeat [Carpediemonas membranifera]
MATCADRSANQTVYNLYVRERLDECLSLIDVMESAGTLTEYAIFIKGLIFRRQGKIAQSYSLFEQVVELNPNNASYLKQMARSATLLGLHSQAIQLYGRLEELKLDDWESWYHKGSCLTFVQDYDAAREAFLRANDIERHLPTYLKLGKLCVIVEDYQYAIKVYTEALGFAPLDPGLLRTVGLLKLRLGETQEAFQLLGRSLVYDKRAPRTLLAAASVMQDSGDIDAALAKYRAVAAQRPQSAQLWSNIGLCFLSQDQPFVALQCLRRARYLAPFAWIIAYNQGLVHVSLGHPLAAYHQLRAAAALKPDYAPIFGLMGVVLADLGDADNCLAAFDRALEFDPDSAEIRLNKTIALFRLGRDSAGRAAWAGLQSRWGGESDLGGSPEVSKAAKQIAKYISINRQ